MRIKIVLLFAAGFVLLAFAACGTPVTPPPAATTVPATVAPATDTVAAPSPTSEPPTVAAVPATEEPARPSNPGNPGKAVDLTGVVDAGKIVYAKECAVCHGADGKGGVPNPGSDDGTVPPINPIDDTLRSTDYKTYATNLDLFIEHGSTPAGTKPALLMTALGDTGKLTPQQIADVIAYVISLNK